MRVWFQNRRSKQRKMSRASISGVSGLSAPSYNPSYSDVSNLGQPTSISLMSIDPLNLTLTPFPFLVPHRLHTAVSTASGAHNVSMEPLDESMI